MSVTKQEFAAYERVRQSGAYNMLTEGRMAADEAGLSKERYHAVMDEYSLCMKKWPSIRKGKVGATRRKAVTVDVEALKESALDALDALKEGIATSEEFRQGGSVVKLLRRTREAIELLEREY